MFNAHKVVANVRKLQLGKSINDPTHDVKLKVTYILPHVDHLLFETQKLNYLITQIVQSTDWAVTEKNYFLALI